MSAEKTQNKKSKWGIVALVVCVLVIIGVFAQGRFKPDPPHTEPTIIDIPTTSDDPMVRILNLEYKALMDKYVGYVDSDVVSTGLACESYAKEFEDDIDMLKVVKLAYKDNVVVEWKITLCMDISGYSSETVDKLEKNFRADYDSVYGSLSCSEVTYNRLPSCFLINIHMKGLDDLSNVRKLIEKGAITQDGEVALLAMKGISDSYLSDGYIQKYIEP